VGSTWRVSKNSLTTASTQTLVTKVCDSENQSINTNNVSCQSMPEAKVKSYNNLRLNIDYQSLELFLQNVEPQISHLLLDNIKSKAFKGIPIITRLYNSMGSSSI
jgi:predicted P-loop ATPase/GTPase